MDDTHKNGGGETENKLQNRDMLKIIKKQQKLAGKNGGKNLGLQLESQSIRNAQTTPEKRKRGQQALLTTPFFEIKSFTASGHQEKNSNKQ